MSRKSRSKKNAQGDSAKSTEKKSAPAESAEQPAKAKVEPTTLPTVQPATYATAHASDSRSLKTRFSFYVLLAVILGISLLSFRVMKGFVLPLFLAALTVVIFKPVHNWIRSKLGDREALAAGLTTAAILLVVLAPLGCVLTIGIVEAVDVSRKFDATDLQELGKKLDPVREKLGVDIRFEDELDDVEKKIQSLKLEQDPGASLDFEAKLQNANLFKDEFKQLQGALNATKATRNQLESELNANPEEKEQKRIEHELKWIERISDSALEKKLGELETTDSDETDEEVPNATRLMAFLNDLKDQKANAEQVDEYNSLVETLEIDFQLARQQIMGGPVLSTLTELANPAEEILRSWQKVTQDLLRDLLFKFTGKTTSVMGSLAMQLFILSIAIYYFLLDGPEMVNAAMHLSPMDDRYEKEMINEFAKLSRAVVVATLLSAIAQGILAGIGYFCCWQFESLFMLMILTTVLAMVPFVGAAAIWVPCCIYLGFVEGRPVAAIALGLYGFLIISMADNIIKPMVLKGQSNLHPLFALLSVIGGVQALGPVGVLVGPMLVAFLQSLLKLLNRDLGAADESALQST